MRKKFFGKENWSEGNLLRLISVLLFTVFIISGCKLNGSSTGDDKDAGNANSEDPGDDTYVPNFKAGNLTFTDVWVENRMDSGLETPIWFDIEAEEAKYNVYVRLDLLLLPEGNASDLVIDPDNYKPDYSMGGIVIEQLAKDEKRHVEQTLMVPVGIPDGVYAAVFTINPVDFYPEDDDLQGEVNGDSSDNYVVGSASVVIGRPELPNVRILSNELANNSFDLTAFGDNDQGETDQRPILTLNMEIEAMAQHVTEDDVDVIFDLDIPGVGTFPLAMDIKDGEGNLALTDVWTYPIDCKDVLASEEEADPEAQGVREVSPDEVDGSEAAVENPMIEVCASLFRQEQVGRSYNLYIDQTAFEALAALTDDVDAELVITVDPDGRIQEYDWDSQNGKSDNVKRLPLMFLFDDRETANRAGRVAAAGPYDSKVLDWQLDKMYGNEWFGSGYVIGPDISYRGRSIGGKTIPTAVYAGGEFTIKAKLFKKDQSLFSVFQKADYDIDDILGSAYDYGATILDYRIWGNRYGLKQDKEGNAKEVTLWTSQDEDENERFAKSKTFLEKGTTFVVVCIPIDVTGKVTGEVGLKGEVKIGKENKLTLEGGPYVSLTAAIEAAINLAVVKAGVGGELLLVEVGQKAEAMLQLLPSVPSATFEFGAPAYIKTLDGKFYLFAKRLKWKWWKFYWVEDKKTLVKWDGLSWEKHWFTPYSHTWQ